MKEQRYFTPEILWLMSGTLSVYRAFEISPGFCSNHCLASAFGCQHSEGQGNDRCSEMRGKLRHDGGLLGSNSKVWEHHTRSRGAFPCSTCSSSTYTLMWFGGTWRKKKAFLCWKELLRGALLPGVSELPGLSSPGVSQSVFGLSPCTKHLQEGATFFP